MFLPKQLKNEKSRNVVFGWKETHQSRLSLSDVERDFRGVRDEREEREESDRVSCVVTCFAFRARDSP